MGILPPVLWMIKQRRLNLDLQNGIFDTSCPHTAKQPRSLRRNSPCDTLAAGCPCQTCWLKTLGPNRAESLTSESRTSPITKIQGNCPKFATLLAAGDSGLRSPGWGACSCQTEPSTGMLLDEFKCWLSSGCFHRSLFLVKRLKYKLRATGIKCPDQKQNKLPGSV